MTDDTQNALNADGLAPNARWGSGLHCRGGWIRRKIVVALDLSVIATDGWNWTITVVMAERGTDANMTDITWTNDTPAG